MILYENEWDIDEQSSHEFKNNGLEVAFFAAVNSLFKIQRPVEVHAEYRQVGGMWGHGCFDIR